MTTDTPATREALLQQVRAALEAGQRQRAVELLLTLHPADQAEIFQQLPPHHQIALLRTMDVEHAAELLEELHEHEAAEVADDLAPERLADILDEMDPEDAADLLGDLPADLAEQVLAQMEEAEDVAPLLQYPDDTAGGLMSTEYVVLHKEATVADALAALRALAAEEDMEIPYYLFVVDDEHRLVGVVDVRDLLLAPSLAHIEDIMDPEVISVHAMTDQEEVARIMQKYELAALPVVDDEGHILGVVSYEDVLEVLEEETTEDILHMGGVESGPLLEKPYWKQRILEVARSRFFWLLFLFVAETFTGTVLRYFDDELQRVITLSYFIPLLIGTGGNAGSQVVATMIRALTLREVRPRDVLRVIWKELRVALLLGLAIGVVAFLRAELWGTDYYVSLTVAIAMVVVVLWATLVAVVVPLAAVALRLDPTLVAGPFMATFIDGTGLLLYFLIAHWVVPELR